MIIIIIIIVIIVVIIVVIVIKARCNAVMNNRMSTFYVHVVTATTSNLRNYGSVISMVILSVGYGFVPHGGFILTFCSQFNRKDLFSIMVQAFYR
jgi:hypothetical protein